MSHTRACASRERDSKRGPRTVRIRVGGTTLVVRGQRFSSGALFPAASRPFLASRGSDIRIQIVKESPPRPAPSGLLFESGGIWRVHRWPDGVLYSFGSPDGKDETCRALATDLDRRTGTLYLPPSPWRDKRGFALSYPLGELLLQHHAARAGGAFLHACGVKTEKEVFVFCGPSGAGKTTMARLWRRHRPHAIILSDDRVLLRQRRGITWAFGTPWHGSGGFASPASARVAAIFFLRHGRKTCVRRLREPGAAAELFARSFLPPWEAETVQRVLAHCDRVAGAVPCFRLFFRPDRSVIEAVEGCCLG